MKKKLPLLCAAITAALGATAAPPMHGEPQEHNDLKEAAHLSFQESAPEGQKDDVPHFAIFGKEGKFYLGVGGKVKVTFGEDWGTPLENPNEFITSQIRPLPAGNKSRFHLSAQQSSIFVSFVAFPDSKDRISAYVGFNFLNDYVPVLQNAYLKWRGLKAGYDYTAFSDNGAMPPSIDYEDPCGATPIPVPTLTYTHSFGKNKEWSVMGGVELPQYSITPNRHTDGVTQGAPDIPVAIRYSWNKGADWVKASAVVRNLVYHNNPVDRNIDVLGWGVELSGTAEIAPNLRAFWTGIYGRGIASYIQDLAGMKLDLTPRGTEVPLKASRTWGAFGGFQYDFSEDVYASATYSQVRNYAKPWANSVSTDAWDGTYRYAQYAVANVFWNITPILTTGVEYIYGRRVNNDGSQSHTNRLQGMLQVAF